MSYILKTFKFIITLAVTLIGIIIILYGIFFFMKIPQEAISLLFTAITLPITIYIPYVLPSWAFQIIGVIIVLIGTYVIIKATESIIHQIYFFRKGMRVIRVGHLIPVESRRAADVVPSRVPMIKPVPEAERPTPKKPAEVPEHIHEIYHPLKIREGKPIKKKEISKKIEKKEEVKKIGEEENQEKILRQLKAKITHEVKKVEENLLKKIKPEDQTAQMSPEAKEELARLKKEIEEKIAKEYKERIKILKVE